MLRVDPYTGEIAVELEAAAEPTKVWLGVGLVLGGPKLPWLPRHVHLVVLRP